MLPEQFKSVAIITYIEITTNIFSKQNFQLSNCKTPTRASEHLLAKIFVFLKPDATARGRARSKNQLQKDVLLLNKDNLLDCMQPENFNTVHINFKSPMKPYSTCHLGLNSFYRNFLS